MGGTHQIGQLMMQPSLLEKMRGKWKLNTRNVVLGEGLGGRSAMLGKLRAAAVVDTAAPAQALDIGADTAAVIAEAIAAVAVLCPAAMATVGDVTVQAEAAVPCTAARRTTAVPVM
jgi:hypothetical protein